MTSSPTERRSAPQPPKRGRFEKPRGQQLPPDFDEDDEEEFPKKRRPFLRALLALLLILVLVVSIAALAADQWILRHARRGKEQLKISYENAEIALPQEDEHVISYDDGRTVSYNGHTYARNENLSTVLIMGIDRKNIEAVDVVGTGGQADVLLLLALDTETGELNILNIPRDTYAEMVLYSSEGSHIGYEKLQICLAYAYGDGRQSSCENVAASVSHLLYGMPISKYLAIDMEGVVAANEAVGGVTVQALEDMDQILLPDGRALKEGDKITLHGKNCELYIRERGNEVDANAPRMERQMQFVNAFSAQLSRQARRDFSAISDLYRQIEPYYVSTLDLSDVIFLAGTYLSHSRTMQFLSFEGSYDYLENSLGKRNAVFYADETSLFEAVLAVYYKQVD